MWYDLSIVCHYKNNRFSPATYLCLGTVVPWWHGSLIYNYLCNQCLSPLMLWVGMSIRTRCTTLCDNVCLWLASGRWFSSGPPVSSSTKSDCHDIADIPRNKAKSKLYVPAPSRELDFQPHKWWVFLFYSDFFPDMDWILKKSLLRFIFIIINEFICYYMEDWDQ
jgi:hypothetical protein